MMLVLFFTMASLELPKPKSRTQYTKSMLLSLSYLLYYRRKKTFVWDLFRNDPGVFNEDVCETSLSLLARAITSRPKLRELDSANKTFKRLGLFSAASNGLFQETSPTDAFALHSASRISKKGEEVKLTTAFLQRLLTSVQNNVCMEYDPRYTFTYEKDATLRNLTSAARLKDINLLSVVAIHMQKFKKQQLVAFIQSDSNIAEFWPEAREGQREIAQVVEEVDSDRSDQESKSDGESELSDDSPGHDSDSDDRPDPGSRPDPLPEVEVLGEESKQPPVSPTSNSGFEPRIASVSSKRARNAAATTNAVSEPPNQRPRRACLGRVSGNYTALNWPSSSDDDCGSGRLR